MIADPARPIDESAERIADSLEQIAEALTELTRDKLVTQHLNREAFERFGATRDAE
jgi:hypothetical protein